MVCSFSTLVTLLFRHCEERDSSLTLRNSLRNLGGEPTGLPRSDKSGLAMTREVYRDNCDYGWRVIAKIVILPLEGP
jgi:hypothetical protein